MSDLAWIIISAVIALALALVGTFYQRGLRAVERMRLVHDKELTRVGGEHDARLQRLSREAEEVVRYAHHGLVRDLLPALDALHEACALSRPRGTGDAPAEVNENEANHAIAEWSRGLALTVEQLDTVLKKHGIETIVPCPQEPFDPNRHEAVHIETRDDMVSDVIVRVLRRGYRQDDRVLRPAMVVVSRGTRGDEVLAEEKNAEDPRDTGSEAFDD